MDIDKSLDEQAPQRTRAPRRGNGADRRPRLSRDRQSDPYSRPRPNRPSPPPRSTSDKWEHDAYDGPRGPRGSRRAPPTSHTPEVFVGSSPRIQISGIHYEVGETDLKAIFSQAGTIVQGPQIDYDRSGRSTGVAVIEYASAQQAKLAINKFDGAMTKGQTISIRLIAPKHIQARQLAQEAQSRQNAKPSVPLLNRVQGGLQSRIAAAKPAPVAAPARSEPRRDARRGRGTAGRGRRRAAPSAADLDAQLDAYRPSGDVAME